MYTDISYAANEEIRKHLGDELFYKVVDINSSLYPFHCKIIGDLIVHESISKEPLKATAYATPNIETDEQYIVEELDIEHYADGLSYDEVHDQNVLVSGEPPAFQGKYISIDPIIWELLPPQVLFEGYQYYKYKDSSGSVNYVNQGTTCNRVLFAEANPNKSNNEKFIEKEFREFTQSQNDIVSTDIGTEIVCLMKLLAKEELAELTKEHIKLFVDVMLELVHDEE